jgi:hypothetical protein
MGDLTKRFRFEPKDFADILATEVSAEMEKNGEHAIGAKAALECPCEGIWYSVYVPNLNFYYYTLGLSLGQSDYYAGIAADAAFLGCTMACAP